MALSIFSWRVSFNDFLHYMSYSPITCLSLLMLIRPKINLSVANGFPTHFISQKTKTISSLFLC
jgi:hypothetical protein